MCLLRACVCDLQSGKDRTLWSVHRATMLHRGSAYRVVLCDSTFHCQKSCRGGCGIYISSSSPLRSVNLHSILMTYDISWLACRSRFWRWLERFINIPINARGKYQLIRSEAQREKFTGCFALAPGTPCALAGRTYVDRNVLQEARVV